MSRNLEAVNIVDGVLRLLVVTGMVGGVLLAPNAVQLGNIALKKLDKRSRMRNVRSLVNYMKYKGWVDYSESTSGDWLVTITDKGRSRFTHAQFRGLSVPKTNVWDGKWRLVLFDISETQRYSRNAFSYKLKNLGFYRLQRSVWVYPYDCANEIEIIRQVYQIADRDIVMIEVDLVNREKELKEFFKIDT